MSGRRVAQFVCSRVEMNVGGGHELVLRLTPQDVVNVGEKDRGIGVVAPLRRRRKLDHGGNEGGRHAVTRDIGNQETGLMLIGDDVVIEIASYRSHRQVACGDSEVWRIRELRGQNRELDAAGHLQFLPNLAELLVAFAGGAWWG